MLTSFTANATDPDVIVWNDPLQASNSMLSFALFGDTVYGGNDISAYTTNASKSLLYPAVKAGLKQPDSYPRQGVSDFAFALKVQSTNDLGPANTWAGSEAVVPDVDGTVGSVSFDTTPDADPAFVNVRAEIPASAVSSAGKLFGRLYSSGEC